MSSMRIRLWSLALLISMLGAGLAETTQARKTTEQADEIPVAQIYGEAGERYDLFGTGGITVTQSPRPGMWHSNMRSYHIDIDGSGMSPSGLAPSNGAGVFPEADFIASAGSSYFVSGSATCTLKTAAGVAGKEIIVCNASKDGTITYNTTFGETISGNQSGAVTNSTPYKVDRFISDGKTWYKE
jgi:hypothetical protein